MKAYNKIHDSNLVSNFIAYPAWQGPQIVVLVKWNNVSSGSNYKIVRNESTFPEDVNHGTVVSSGVTDSSKLNYFIDFSVEEDNWYYYSIFLEVGSTYQRVAIAESFTFGIKWARDDFWNKHIPDVPYRKDDMLSIQRKISTSHPFGNKPPTSFDDDPQETFYDQEDKGERGELRRYIEYISIEIDKYADLVNSVPKMFRISSAPIFMLELISELLKVEFKKDMSPTYMREQIRMAVPKALRKGVTQVIKYYVRMMLENKNVYIEEYTDHVLYWNVNGRGLDVNGNPSNLVTEASGSFWFGNTKTSSIANCFLNGGYLVDTSLERLISPYVYGMFVFYDVDKTISENELSSLRIYIDKLVCWLLKWFVTLVMPTKITEYSITYSDSFIYKNRGILCWNKPSSGRGWNDPDNILPIMGN